MVGNLSATASRLKGCGGRPMRVLTRGGAHFIDFPVGARQRHFLKQASAKRAKHVDVEWFLYELIGAEQHQVRMAALRSVRGDNDDRLFRIDRENFLEHFLPWQRRQHEIKQYEIVALFFPRREAVRAIDGDFDLVVGIERAPCGFGGVRVIFNDQDAGPPPLIDRRLNDARNRIGFGK